MQTEAVPRPKTLLLTRLLLAALAALALLASLGVQFGRCERVLSVVRWTSAAGLAAGGLLALAAFRGSLAGLPALECALGLAGFYGLSLLVLLAPESRGPGDFIARLTDVLVPVFLFLCLPAAALWLGWYVWTRKARKQAGGEPPARPSPALRAFWTALPSLAAAGLALAVLQERAAQRLSADFASLSLVFCGLCLAAAALLLPRRALEVHAGGWTLADIRPGRLVAQARRRRTAANGVQALFVLSSFFLLLLALLAAGTFHPFRSSKGVLTAAVLAAGALSIVHARAVGLRRRAEAAFGCEGEARRGEMGLPVLSLAAAAVCLLAVLLGTHAVWHARFDAFERETKAQGLPTSLADFREDFPDEEYAYPALEKVQERFDGDFLSKATNGFPTGVRAWDEKSSGQSRDVAGHYRAFIERELLPVLASHRRLAKTDYVLAAKNPGKAPMPRVYKLLAIGQAARHCALAQAREGRAGSHWKALDTVFALAGIVGRDHTLIAKMVAVALRGMGAKTAIVIIAGRPDTLPPFMSDRLAAVQKGGLVREGLQGSLAAVFDWRRMGEPRLLHEAGILTEGDRPSLLEVLADAALARFAVWEGLVDAGCLKWGERLRETIRRAGTMEGPPAAEERLPVWPYLLADIAASESGNLAVKEREVGTWARMAQLASALNAFRAKRGRYPGALAELSPGLAPPELLSDLVAGRPFEYGADPACKEAKACRRVKLCSLGVKGDGKLLNGDEFCATL